MFSFIAPALYIELQTLLAKIIVGYNICTKIFDRHSIKKHTCIKNSMPIFNSKKLK